MRNKIFYLILITFFCFSSCKQDDAQKTAIKPSLKTSTVGTIIGSSYESYIRDTVPDAQIHLYESVTDLLLAIDMGKVESAMVDGILLNILNYDNRYIINEVFYVEDFGFGFNKSDKKLLRQFNDFIKQIKDDGTYDKIHKNWLSHDSKCIMPDLSNIKRSGKPIVFGCTGTCPYFDYISDNQNAGFDIEIFQRFAASLKRPVEFRMMNFAALIASIMTSKVDIIGSAITITEERGKKINFSNPYVSSFAPLIYLNPEYVSASASEQDKLSFLGKLKESITNNLIKEERYKLIFDGLWNTLVISIFAALLGTILGALICLMKMSKSKILSSVAKGYISLIRGTPVLVLLMIIFYVVFAKVEISAVLVAVIAFAMNFAAYASEMFRTSIEGVDRGQFEAGAAMGFTQFKTFRFIVLPQAVKAVLPVYKGEIISLLKMTSIVGYIAVQDLTKASDIIRSRTFDAFFPLIVITIIYFVLAWLIGMGLDAINNKVNKRK